MSNSLFKKIVQRCEEHERNYTKVRDNEMFQWFDEVAKPTLQLYCKEDDKFEYELDNNGITVEIEIEEYLMLPYMQKEIIEVLELVDTCIIKPVHNNKIKIHLWFRGWKWEKEN